MFKKTLVLATAIAALHSPISQADQNVLIGTTSASSSHYGYFVAVSKLINSTAEGVKSSVAETGATLDNLRRLKRNQVDIGLVTTNTMSAAYNGTGAFEGAAVKSKLLWIYALAPQNVVVRGDANINSLEELSGRKFNPGIRGSSTEATSEKVLALLGIEVDAVRGSTSDIVNGIKDNRLAGYVKSGSGMKLDASSRDIAAQTEIKVLGLNDEQLQKVKSELPQLSIVDVPANAEMNLPAYTAWGFGVGASASESLDEDAAYQIVKVVMEDTEHQVAAMANLKGQNMAEMTLKYATSPLHPATVKYLEEQGYTVPSNLID